MKKTFKLTHEKIKPARLAESAKHEVKKYLTRERKKALPKGADFWDFECRFGLNQESAEEVHVAEINKAISQAETDAVNSFYLEVFAVPAVRTQKPEGFDNDSESDFEDELIELVEE